MSNVRKRKQLQIQEEYIITSMENNLKEKSGKNWALCVD